MLVDDQAEAGGCAARHPTTASTAARPLDWVAELRPNSPPTPTCCTCSAPPSSATTTTASSSRCSGAPTTSAPTRAAASARQRIWRIRPGTVVLATGAHERPIVFADNDRPGVMLAEARPHLPAPLRRTGRSAGGRVHHQRQRLRRGRRPRAAGVQIVAVVDTRTARHRTLRRASAPSVGIRDPRPDPSSPAPTAPTGRRRHGAPRVTADGSAGERRGPAGDLLLVSGGWNPAVHLFSQAGGQLRYDPDARRVPARPAARPTVRVVGAAGGLLDLPRLPAPTARAAGALAHRRSPGARWCRRPAGDLPAAVGPAPPATAGTWSPRRAPTRPTRRSQFVDLQRDVTVADLVRATGAGLRVGGARQAVHHGRHRARPGQDVRA